MEPFDMIAFKLFTLRKDGTIGPLFINRKQVVGLGQWYEAESHPTKGFAYRKGWHCTVAPFAPHLSKKQRIWGRVEIEDVQEYKCPQSQGGKWLLAQRMKVLEVSENITEQPTHPMKHQPIQPQKEFAWGNEPFRLAQETTLDGDRLQRERETKTKHQTEANQNQTLLPCVSSKD